jgi:protease-4
VAIVHVEGPILPGAPGNDPFSLLGGGAAYSTPIRAALDRAAKDETVKAVVLRVNSPGGSAVASEIILEATKRVKATKPLVVSMGDVAGSGGYYVACGAETIFADRSTITGSIGVVSGKLSTKGLWQKLGVHWESTKRGANAGMLSGSDVFTNEQRERMQSFMDEIYGVFKGHVVAIRGAKLKKDIEELAGGRVYAGRQALELGLVDQLGGLDDAIRFVASQDGLKEGEYEIRTLPQPPSFLEMLTGEPAADPDPHSVAMPADWLRPTERLWRSAESYLEGLDPQRTAAVRQAFLLLSVMQREQVGLTMTPLRVRN